VLSGIQLVRKLTVCATTAFDSLPQGRVRIYPRHPTTLPAEAAEFAWLRGSILRVKLKDTKPVVLS